MFAGPFAYLWLAACGVCCYAIALGLHVRIVKAVNKGVSEADRVSYLLHFRAIGLAERKYKKLFPRSKLPSLTLILIVASIALGIGALAFRVWKLTVMR